MTKDLVNNCKTSKINNQTKYTKKHETITSTTTVLFFHPFIKYKR